MSYRCAEVNRYGGLLACSDSPKRNCLFETNDSEASTEPSSVLDIAVAFGGRLAVKVMCCTTPIEVIFGA